jgi:hypothetical protein
MSSRKAIGKGNHVRFTARRQFGGEKKMNCRQPDDRS